MKVRKACFRSTDFNIWGKYCSKNDLLLVSKILWPASCEAMDLIFQNKYIYVDFRTKNLYLLDTLIWRIQYSSYRLYDFTNLEVSLKRRLANVSIAIDFVPSQIDHFFIYKDLLSERETAYNNIRYLYHAYDSKNLWEWRGYHPFFGRYLYRSVDRYDTTCEMVEKLQDYLWGTPFGYYTHTIYFTDMFPGKDFSKMYTHTYSVYSNLYDLKNSETVYSYHYFDNRQDFSKYLDRKDYLIKNIHKKYYKLNYYTYDVD